MRRNLLNLYVLVSISKNSRFPVFISATLEIANLALLTPWMEFENFCGQIFSFEVL